MLDTNRYTDLCDGEKSVVEAVHQSAEVALPFVVIAELRAGFACGSKARRNEAILVRFLNEACVRIVYADEETTHHYASLYKHFGEGVAG